MSNQQTVFGADSFEVYPRRQHHPISRAAMGPGEPCRRVSGVEVPGPGRNNDDPAARGGGCLHCALEAVPVVGVIVRSAAAERRRVEVKSPPQRRIRSDVKPLIFDLDPVLSVTTQSHDVFPRRDSWWQCCRRDQFVQAWVLPWGGFQCEGGGALCDLRRPKSQPDIGGVVRLEVSADHSHLAAQAG